MALYISAAASFTTAAARRRMALISCQMQLSLPCRTADDACRSLYVQLNAFLATEVKQLQEFTEWRVVLVAYCELTSSTRSTRISSIWEMSTPPKLNFGHGPSFTFT